MDRPILKVTVITGAIGPALHSALHDAGLQVQGLTRRSENSTATFFVPGVRIFEVDYTNGEELDVALKDQDAVISTLGDTAGAVAAQKALIESSIRMGVRRFIPSEFGSDTFNERVRSMPFFAAKLKHQELLRIAAEKHKDFSYTIVITGPFLDWGLSVVPFILDFGSRNGQVFDGGNTPFSTTRIPTLCTAVLSILANPQSTANRTLYIHDAIVTQNQLISRFNALYAPFEVSPNFTCIPVCTKQLESKAWSSYKDPLSNPLDWIFPFINISIWSKERMCMFERVDNHSLGLLVIEGTELDDVLDHEIRKAVASFDTKTLDDELSQIDELHPGASIERTTTAAEKALEDGKLKLVGWQKPLDQ